MVRVGAGAGGWPAGLLTHEGRDTVSLSAVRRMSHVVLTADPIFSLPLMNEVNEVGKIYFILFLFAKSNKWRMLVYWHCCLHLFSLH